MTYTIFIVLILIIALLLILIIMVQNPKGGGLDSSFGGGGGSQLGGVQSTNKFLDKTTWILAMSLFALILLSNFVVNRGGAAESQISTDGIEITTPEAPKTGGEVENTDVPPVKKEDE